MTNHDTLNPDDKRADNVLDTHITESQHGTPKPDIDDEAELKGYSREQTVSLRKGIRMDNDSIERFFIASNPRVPTDPAPFCLWVGNSSPDQYRVPTIDEAEWFNTTFKPEKISFMVPHILMWRPKTRPQSATVGSMHVIIDPGNPKHPLLAGIPGNFRSSDPLPQSPTRKEIVLFIMNLFAAAVDAGDLISITFHWTTIMHITLRPSINIPQVLPYRIGTLVTRYIFVDKLSQHHRSSHNYEQHHENTTTGHDERLTASETDNPDRSIYDPLRTGVLVSSEDELLSTTLGVAVKNVSGDLRFAVASHGFPGGGVVLQPDSTRPIGRIQEKYEHIDVSLVQLYPSVGFALTYFGATVPKKLLTTGEFKIGDVVEAYSTFGGLHDFMVSGLRISLEGVFSLSELTFYPCVSGAGPSRVVDRICGSPMVREDGGVIGQYSLQFVEEPNISYMYPLDEIVSDGWQVAL